MDPKRPQGRQKYVTDNSKGTAKRGDGLNTGPVGGESRPGGQNSQRADFGVTGGSTARRTRSRSPLLGILAVAAILLGGGGGLFGSGVLGGESVDTTPSYSYSTPAPATSSGSQSSQSGGSFGGYSSYTSQSNPYASLIQGSASQESVNTSSQNLDTTVASGAREKRTQIIGQGADTVTIMVYMCGTDLESRSAMATKDMVEMTKANIADNVNILVYTGGCTRWQNQVVSASTNQIYKIENGGLRLQADKIGSLAMTKPSTLSSFIQWCDKNYPANRYELILWDHGGGSVSGYGYDQKYPNTGSMSLAGINTALKDAGVKFDFVGFDACLMATMETGLMLDNYADYMIASEETEPGIGWYYTDWLTKLSANTSMPTVQIGKNIVDDFVNTCVRETPRQSATLSVIDLAELAHTAPAPMKAFSQSLSELITNDNYRQVSDARNGTREFARSTVIDQIDLVHFAKNIGNEEGTALAEALRGAVKYNRTSSDMTNAYGLSIYFPYRKASNVDKAVSTYSAIGMDESYSQCIREFASLEVSGQVASGGSSNPYFSLTGSPYGSSSDYASYGDMDMINTLLGAFLGGDYSSMTGYSGSNTDFFSGRSMSMEDTVSYLADNRFDASALTWTINAAGEKVISLSEEQWALVEGLELNLFYDDGEGYIDFGLDNVYDFDEEGKLLAPTDGTWLAVNGQPVAYYFESSSGEGEQMVINGRIPAMLNGERVDLLVVFDSLNPRGIITGARSAYVDGETETVAKSLTELEIGDTLDFICDYYSYDGEYQNSYYLGEPMTVTETMEISNVDVGDGAKNITYRFTDLYQQHYWTPAIIR